MTLWTDQRRKLEQVRNRAVDLALHAVDRKGRDVGDPVHEEVTQGRTKNNEIRRRRGSKEVPYSSCGDLAHWMLYHLGCRDPLLVNREEPQDGLRWVIGANVSRIRFSPHFILCSNHPDARPSHGDILLVVGAAAGSEHVSVLVSDMTDEYWVTADYGQPYGRLRDCDVSVADGRIWVAPRDRGKGGRRLVGWLDLGRVFGR